MKRMVLVVGMAVAAGGVEAAVVAGWDVNGVELDVGSGLDAPGAPYAFSATTGEPASVIATLTLGDGVNPSTSADQYGFKISSSDQTNSLAGAIESQHYLEFSLSVSSGYELNLSTIEMNGQATGSGCSNLVLMSSMDGFTVGNEIASASPVNVTGGFDTDISGFGSPIDLSDIQYQNLTGSISFRLYGWNSTSGSGSTYLRNLVGNDLLINGSIVELPSSESPTLSLIASNGTGSVSAVFTGVVSTNYVLQHQIDLTDSNGWSTVSSPFTSNATWAIETTNTAGFYRAIIQ